MNNQPHKAKLPGKNSRHRDSVVRSLVLELIRNERLQSTPKKVKLLQATFDRLVSKAKKDTAATRRTVKQYLNHDKAIAKFYNKILPRLDADNSGYTLTANTLPRKGDNAPQKIILIKGAEVKARQSMLQKAMSDSDE